MASNTRSVLTFPRLQRLSPLGKLLTALGAFLAWTALTWVLEGRIQTLLRPEAVVDRLLYTGLVNVVVGSFLALLLVRAFVADGFVSRAQLGFRTVPRSVAAAIIGGGLGLAIFALQDPATMAPVVVANVFAQVLPVSIAEVVVCWVVVGGSLAAYLRHHGRSEILAKGVALVVSAVLFGIYHLAHSPPFNTVSMVGLLTVVGLGTGLVYVAGGSFYGALAFHNFMALFGVVGSLAAADQIGAYAQPLLPLLVTGLVALLVVVATERRLVRSPVG